MGRFSLTALKLLDSLQLLTLKVAAFLESVSTVKGIIVVANNYALIRITFIWLFFFFLIANLWHWVMSDKPRACKLFRFDDLRCRYFSVFPPLTHEMVSSIDCCWSFHLGLYERICSDIFNNMVEIVTLRFNIQHVVSTAFNFVLAMFVPHVLWKYFCVDFILLSILGVALNKIFLVR